MQHVILRELSSGVSRSYLRGLRFPMPLSTAILKTQGKKIATHAAATTRVSWYWIRNVRDRQYPSGLFPLHSSMEKDFLSPGISGIKPREEWKVCMPRCTSALDIPISWYRECFSSRHPRLLSGIYTLFMEFIIRSQPTLYALPAPLPSLRWKPSGITLLRIRQFPCRDGSSVFPQDFPDEGNPDPTENSNSPFVREKTLGNKIP